MSAVSSGFYRIGGKVTAMPSRFSSNIKSITGPKGELLEAFARMSIALELEENIDISRGDMILRSNNTQNTSQDIEVMLS